MSEQLPIPSRSAVERDDARDTAPPAPSAADGFRRFWQAERASLLRLCRRWTRDPSEAEDLLADACVKAFETACARPEAIANPGAYCARIIANLARDRLRSRRRQAPLGRDADAPDAADVTDTTVGSDARLLAKRELEDTLRRLGSLNESQRTALVLRSLGGEYDDIAGRLGTTNTNARKLVQTARDALRAAASRPGSAAVETSRSDGERAPSPADPGGVASAERAAAPSTTLPRVGTLKRASSGREYLLAARHVVGRAPLCHLRLDELSVSAIHADLVWDGSAWLLRDLGSRNGTFVGGARIVQGQQIALEHGAEIAFGEPGLRFRLIDRSAPRLMALGSANEVIVAEEEALCLPSPAAVEAMIYPAASGGWAVEVDGRARPLEDQDEIVAGGRKWRICLPGSAAMTREPFAPEEELSLRFDVSRDEERVTVRAERGNRSFVLEPRAHSYLLLTLARARLRDACAPHLAESERGWIDRESLLRMLRIDMLQLNLWVFRARQQFGQVGLGVSGAIIERRAGTQELRLGTSRLVIDRASDRPGSGAP